MTYIPKRLVDGAVRPYAMWLVELRTEDISEFGHVIKRPKSALFELYEIYKTLQRSPEYVTIREADNA